MAAFQDTEFDIVNCIGMIKENYSEIPLETIVEGIRNGYSGKYGRFFKLTPHEVLVWIETKINEPRRY